jgi:hypothetical protein
MANRSYLYSADALPTEESLPSPIKCISEHNWSIPLAHHLLVGRETAVVPSIIWGKRVGVSADFGGGVELLTGLLQAVGRGEVPERDAFDECVERTTVHLEKQRAAHFLLEPGEILTLAGDDPEEELRRLVAVDIPKSVMFAEAMITGEKDEWLSAIRERWRPCFDVFYSDWLYHSFPEG